MLVIQVRLIKKKNILHGWVLLLISLILTSQRNYSCKLKIQTQNQKSLCNSSFSTPFFLPLQFSLFKIKLNFLVRPIQEELNQKTFQFNEYPNSWKLFIRSLHLTIMVEGLTWVQSPWIMKGKCSTSPPYFQPPLFQELQWGPTLLIPWIHYKGKGCFPSLPQVLQGWRESSPQCLCGTSSRSPSRRNL